MRIVDCGCSEGRSFTTRKVARFEAPSLHRSYPASSVLRASPPSHTAWPVSRELPVDPYCDHRWDFPCCTWSSPLRTCRRQYPGRSDGTCSLVPFHQLRPSHEPGRVGSCIVGFGACSAFTHVTAYTLAKSPSDSLHQRLQQSRCLHRCSDCYRVERTSSRAGIPPLWTSAFTAHQSCPRFGHNRQSQKLKHLSGFLTWRLIPQLFQAAVVTRTAD